MGSETPHECKHGVLVYENAEQKRQCALCISEAGDALWGRMAGMLKSLEWSGSKLGSKPGYLKPCCPSCMRPYNMLVPENAEHSPDCRLAKLLSELP